MKIFKYLILFISFSSFAQEFNSYEELLKFYKTLFNSYEGTIVDKKNLNKENDQLKNEINLIEDDFLSMVLEGQKNKNLDFINKTISFFILKNQLLHQERMILANNSSTENLNYFNQEILNFNPDLNSRESFLNVFFNLQSIKEYLILRKSNAQFIFYNPYPFNECKDDIHLAFIKKGPIKCEPYDFFRVTKKNIYFPSLFQDTLINHLLFAKKSIEIITPHIYSPDLVSSLIKLKILRPSLKIKIITLPPNENLYTSQTHTSLLIKYLIYPRINNTISPEETMVLVDGKSFLFGNINRLNKNPSITQIIKKKKIDVLESYFNGLWTDSKNTYLFDIENFRPIYNGRPLDKKSGGTILKIMDTLQFNFNESF